MKKLISSLVFIFIVAVGYFSLAGNYHSFDIDGANHLPYFQVYIDTSDTGTDGVAYYVDSGATDTLDIGAWGNISRLMLSFKRIDYDTGHVGAKSGDSDHVADSLIWYLYTSPALGGDPYLISQDTFTATGLRDSVIYRAIVGDSLYQYIYMKYLFWDSFSVTTNDTNTQRFKIEAYGE